MFSQFLYVMAVVLKQSTAAERSWVETEGWINAACFRAAALFQWPNFIRVERHSISFELSKYLLGIEAKL